jgi:REP element-mobilizing transposase RayT
MATRIAGDEAATGRDNTNRRWRPDKAARIWQTRLEGEMPINPVVKTPRKRIRLDLDAYRVPGSAWFVTIGCAGRVPAFADPGFAAAVAGLLVARCAALGTGLHLWCLMPDHAHLIVAIRTTGLVDLLQDVKGRSTRLWWAHGGAGTLWQRSFHDRGLRDAEAFEAAVRYVLHNPVEAGLVADWAEYPWLGGVLLTGEDNPPTATVAITQPS